MASDPRLDDPRAPVLAIEQALGRLIAGKAGPIRMALIALIAEGHVLIEDPPGVGKTTLAEGLARALGADFGRIQFTADLLPADVVGVEVFDPVERRFVFHPGPIFHHVVLADEINRATPKAQSALLEAMAERQVTIERTTHPLPRPFFVVATQNPLDQAGVFPLPEAQLDRFFARISLGYPDRASERRLLRGEVGRVQLEGVGRGAEGGAIEAARRASERLPLSDPLLDYALDVVAASRARFSLGISPRAARDWVQAARIHAWLDRRTTVAGADLRAVAVPLLAHRVRVDGSAEDAIRALLDAVPIPG